MQSLLFCHIPSPKIAWFCFAPLKEIMYVNKLAPCLVYNKCFVTLLFLLQLCARHEAKHWEYGRHEWDMIPGPEEPEVWWRQRKVNNLSPHSYGNTLSSLQWRQRSGGMRWQSKKAGNRNRKISRRWIYQELQEASSHLISLEKGRG